MTGQIPQLSDVYRLLSQNANDWDDIGKALKVSDSYRQTLLDQAIMTKVGRKLESVLNKWLESHCSEVSWDNLIRELKRIELDHIVKDVEKYLLTDEDAIRKYNWTKSTPKTSDHKLDEGSNPNPDHKLDEGLVTECKTRIDECVHQPEYKNAQGIILIIGMAGVSGTAIDVEKVQTTFKELGFAVLTTESPKAETLACLIEAAAKPLSDYPLKYKYIAFYYSGHGGEDKSGMFVNTLDVDSSNPILHVEEYIIKPLKELQLTRLFFFDCCQSSGSGKAFRNKPVITGRPKPIAREVIAFATSEGQKALGDTDKGGLWTFHLCEHLKKQDLPLVTVLAKTNDDVVEERKDMQLPFCAHNIGSDLIITWAPKSDTKAITKSRACGSLKKHACYWNDLALELDIDDAFRLTLETSQESDLEKLEKIVGKWIADKTCEVSWEKLKAVMKDLELDDIDEPSDTQPVTKKDVYHCLKKFAHYWNEIALELNIGDELRGSLEKGQLTKHRRLEEVIKKWIEDATCEVSWEKIDEIVKELEGIDGGASANTAPTKPVTKGDVFPILKGRAASWKDFAHELKINDDFLRDLESKKSTNRLKLESVVKKWIEKDTCVSWEKIREVATKLKFDDVAENLDKFLKS